ncbi:MAG TPA: 30S ribosomal protein S3, partial [Anaerolineae bacterium]|nr:30S ribosomal protein S3 [Anaerolineae bacterium]
MGRKVHPIGFRLGIVRDWTTRWYAEGAEYTSLLEEDRLIRKVVREEVPNAGISTVEIERFPNQVYLQIHTAKPG